MASSLLPLAAVVGALIAQADAAPSCRDRRKQPFASTSVWNMPIGSAASFTPANIYATAERPAPASFHNDQDFFFAPSITDPITPFIDQGAWGPEDNCKIVGQQKAAYNFPVDAGVWTCELNNNAAAMLMPDNVTLIQFQPFYRSTPGSPILARYQKGSPDPYPWNISILGDGALGAHGGSGLSSIGGTIRDGELDPSAGPIQHALKLELYAHQYYWRGGDSNTCLPGGAPEDCCYTWPATGCDGYARSPNNGYNGTLPYLKPGALLAVPVAIAPTVRLRTVPAQRILDALTLYGGYLVDDTASNNAAICMEPAVTSQLQQYYGISVNITSPVTPTGPTPASALFYADLVNIFGALHVVTNNGPNSVGGGGKPLAPIAPPICGA